MIHDKDLINFLKNFFPNATLSLIYKINRKNKVKVNKKREDNEYKLQVEDIINIYLNDNEIEELTKKQEEKRNYT